MPVMATIAALKDTYAQLKTRMEKAVEDFRKAMAATRTGRASVHMLDGVTVDYYGSQMPLNQIAQVHAPEAQLITVQPFDPSTLIGCVVVTAVMVAAAAALPARRAASVEPTQALRTE